MLSAANLQHDISPTPSGHPKNPSNGFQVIGTIEQPTADQPIQTESFGNFSCEDSASPFTERVVAGTGGGAAALGGAGAIQKTGYRRCKLLSNSAQTISRVEESSTTGR